MHTAVGTYIILFSRPIDIHISVVRMMVSTVSANVSGWVEQLGWSIWLGRGAAPHNDDGDDDGGAR